MERRHVLRRHDKHTRTILADVDVNERPWGVRATPPSTPAELCSPVFPVSCVSLMWSLTISSPQPESSPICSLRTRRRAVDTYSGHTGAVHSKAHAWWPRGATYGYPRARRHPPWVRTPNRLTRVPVHFLILCSLDSFSSGRLHIQISASIALVRESSFNFFITLT